MTADEDLDLQLEVEGRTDPLAAPLPPAVEVEPYGPASLTWITTSGDELGRIEVTAATSSAGIRWMLPEPLPAGRVRFSFVWESYEEGGLQADVIRVACDGVDDSDNLAFADTDTVRGLGYNDRREQVIYLDTAALCHQIRVYAHGTVAPGVWALPGLVVDNGYVDILGQSNEIKISRGSLDVGTLEATVLDANLDPTLVDVSNTLKPGSTVKVTAVNPATSAREAIFTGRLRRSRITWDTKGWDGSDPAQWTMHPKASRITLTATDALAELSNTSEPRGVSTVDDLRYLMGAHPGLPFNINLSTSSKPSATVCAENPVATLLDQIVIARDSEAGRAWVGRDGALWANDYAAVHIASTVELIADPDLQTVADWDGTGLTTGQTIAGETCSKVTVDGTGHLFVASVLTPIRGDMNLDWSIDLYVTAGTDVSAYVVAYGADGLLLWEYNQDQFPVTVGAGSWYTLSVGGLGYTDATQVVAGVRADGVTGDLYARAAHLTQDTPSLTDSKVSQIDADYDTDNLINACTVTVRVGLGDAVKDVTVGPYSRAASVAKWGPHNVDVTVHSIMNEVDVDSPSAYDQIGETVASLLLQDDPELRVHKAVVPINDPARYIEVFSDRKSVV